MRTEEDEELEEEEGVLPGEVGGAMMVVGVEAVVGAVADRCRL